jgi:pyruvate/2-oxoglutarate dehydrogenase complex dihydrolipoamide acyltransferase (E2) component
MTHRADVQIPLMSQGMTHGVLRRWLVATGERVSIGQSLFELDTDDAVYEVESLDFGVISTTAVEGRSYPVGTAIGYIEFSEEERVEAEYFVLQLTFEMREAIERERGDRSRNEWLREAFRDFVRQRLKLSEQGGTGQPATRPVLDSQGGDKPQHESDGRSR